MKVIHIMDNLATAGGVNSVVFDLCESMTNQGIEVLLIGILKKKESEEINALKKLGVCVKCLNSPNKKHAVTHDIPLLRREIKKFVGEEVTICNLHLKLSVLMGSLAAMGLKNVKCVETYHNMYHHYTLQYTVLYPLIKHYIAISNTCGEEMKRRFHTPTKKMTVIPNGIDSKKIRSFVDTNVKEDKNDSIFMLSVGRLSHEKNFIIPIEAFVNICCDKISYSLIGDGPEYTELKNISEKNKYVNLKGACSRQKCLEEINKADIIVMPSLWEGRSILQMEAMAFNKPLMLSDVPALREVFLEEKLSDSELFRVCKWGYLVQTSNVESYIEAARHFMEHKELKNDMVQYVHQISKKNEMDIMVKSYIRVYKKLLSE